MTWSASFTSMIACAQALSDMAARDTVRSQIVTFLKVGLPLAALALMSTVFLLARAPIKDGDIPYAEIVEIAREPRVSGAQVSGVAKDGTVIELTADRAQPDGNIIRIEGLFADIDAADGTVIDIRAGQGEIDNDTQIARLFGLARLDTSSGYEMETSGLTANLETGRIESEGALEVVAPYGNLTAGRLVIEADAETGQRMLFDGGVRLLYQPQRED